MRLAGAALQRAPGRQHRAGGEERHEIYRLTVRGQRHGRVAERRAHVRGEGGEARIPHTGPHTTASAW
eukprot:31033-Pelagococcus_subviridis.AAC.14